ncbi:hypothetical protein AVEN_10537-1 [Araneus ventricosus]|uniref:ATP-dependent DNA helicase PIF1 n=1 Tax=Araneus ventricosus TaxID=182803 RepID=A0A4Y2G332_ARAVE|nr:hypothetical protein AVEN_10537-1 [Araneus ventricosus]
MANVIQEIILKSNNKGESVFIPRIPLIPSDIPFLFKRFQFPAGLAFTTTINKAQGQSIKVAGINLETPCFTHGQFGREDSVLESKFQGIFTDMLQTARLKMSFIRKL